MSFHNVLNNAGTTLSAAVAPTNLTIKVVADVFPAVPFYLTLGNNPATYEIVEVTAKAGLTFTVVRAQDGTTAKTYAIGDSVQLFMVAGLVTELQATITAHQADYMPHQSGLNSYATSVDANGIYTILSLKRSDTTLYMKSTLSGGTSPSYTTDTWLFYDALGTTVILTKTWTITYDANGKITSKVVA